MFNGSASQFSKLIVRVRIPIPAPSLLYRLVAKASGPYPENLGSIPSTATRVNAHPTEFAKQGVTSTERRATTGRCRMARHLLWGQDEGGSIPLFPTTTGHGSVARALASDARDRRFESSCPDHLLH